MKPVVNEFQFQNTSLNDCPRRNFITLAPWIESSYVTRFIILHSIHRQSYGGIRRAPNSFPQRLKIKPYHRNRKLNARTRTRWTQAPAYYYVSDIRRSIMFHMFLIITSGYETKRVSGCRAMLFWQPESMAPDCFGHARTERHTFGENSF